MSYWNLCWKLQNLGGMEKPKSSLADRTDGRVRRYECWFFWRALCFAEERNIQQKLWKWVRKVLLMGCEHRSTAEFTRVWDLYGSPTWKWLDEVMLAGLWSSVGRPTLTPSLCWADSRLSHGGPLFLSTWAPSDKKVAWRGEGVRDGACYGHPSLPVLDLQFPAVVKGQMIKQPCCSSKWELPLKKLWECEKVQCEKGVYVQGIMQDDLAGKSKAHYRETANVSLKFHFLCSSRKKRVI